MKESIISQKSYSFALKIIDVHRFLTKEKREFVLSKQLLRSGTAIGALMREAKYAESTKDFVHKTSIALKEANETLYWLQLLKDAQIVDQHLFDSIFPLADEMVRILASIVKTTKANLQLVKD